MQCNVLLSTCVRICLSVYLSIYMSVSLSVCLFVCMLVLQFFYFHPSILNSIPFLLFLLFSFLFFYFLVGLRKTFNDEIPNRSSMDADMLAKWKLTRGDYVDR